MVQSSGISIRSNRGIMTGSTTGIRENDYLRM